jgi:hypothetical protein
VKTTQSSRLCASVQQDGRIRRWAPIQEMNGRYLRVILLPDGETVHNASGKQPDCFVFTLTILNGAEQEFTNQ